MKIFFSLLLGQPEPFKVPRVHFLLFFTRGGSKKNVKTLNYSFFCSSSLAAAAAYITSPLNIVNIRVIV